MYEIVLHKEVTLDRLEYSGRTVEGLFIDHLRNIVSSSFSFRFFLLKHCYDRCNILVGRSGINAHMEVHEGKLKNPSNLAKFQET